MLSSGQILKAGDAVKTFENSSATITYPDGSQTRLDQNTEITIISSASDQSVSLFQSIGRTWSRVMRISGGAPKNYEIETPSAVASVRGTAFSTNVTNNKETNVDTDNETVDVSSIERLGKERKILAKIAIEEGFGLDIKPGQKKLVKRTIKEELKNSSWFRDNREKDKKLLEKIKQRKPQGQNVFSFLSQVSGGDLQKIRKLMEKGKGGAIRLTPRQKKQLEPLIEKFKQSGGKVTPEMAPDVAFALSVIEPEDFSDTDHWTKVIRIITPLISKFQFLEVKQ